MESNKIFKAILITLMFTSISMLAQHRGDNLSFQGLTYKDNFSTKAAAMGGAMTAVAGDLSSLFYNMAGLARLNGLQVSVNVNQYDREWRENQTWKVDRQFTTLPFYLEGLYIPKRENHGKWDYDLYKDTANYRLNAPKLGLDPYDRNAAQWTKDNNKFGFRNIAIAYPFTLMERKFVVAASYLTNSITDFDRNETFLSPMITSYDYENNFKRLVNGVDTLNVEWTRFIRERNGLMNNIIVGLSNEVIENIMVGVGVKIQNGESDDYLSQVRYGDIHLIDAQKFKFYFIDYSKIISGTSKYSSTSFNISTLIELSKIKMGLKIDLPYTLTREWNYTTVQKGLVNSTVATSGKDEVKMPAIINVGLSFQPVESFLISFNYESSPFSKAEFNFATRDTTFRQWKDQNTIAFGLEYKMHEHVSLLAGYRSVPEVYVPDGAAIKDKGPASTSYNFGVSISTFLGRVDVAYEYRRLKYYDSYFSNTNYAFESNSSIMVGFTYSL